MASSPVPVAVAARRTTAVPLASFQVPVALVFTTSSQAKALPSVHSGLLSVMRKLPYCSSQRALPTRVATGATTVDDSSSARSFDLMLKLVLLVARVSPPKVGSSGAQAASSRSNREEVRTFRPSS